MFYNHPNRRNMNANEEYKRIVDVVLKYSIHFPMAKFSCRQLDSQNKKTDISTYAVQRPESVKNSQEVNEVRFQIIKKFFGQKAIGQDPIYIMQKWDRLNIAANIVCSKPNASESKKNTFIIFINNRLVEHDKLKKTVESVYFSYQPKGATTYFMYFALRVRPDLIDVNVHPTKKTVIFENEDDLCD